MEPQALVRHSAFLKNLSRALVSDAAQADDLVQETLLAALERPPRRPGSVRSWLACVLRNKVTDHRRREVRRWSRERKAARKDALPSAAEMAERERASRTVVDAVFGLAEPYRSVILYRYYEELPPREIARRQSIPVETVRTRLKRGLQRLREELEKDFRPEGGRSIAALGGLWDSTAPVTTNSAPAALGASTVPLTKALSIGGILMSAKTSVISLSAALFLATFSGYLYTQVKSEARRADAAVENLHALEGSLADSQVEIAALQQSLMKATSREERLAAQLAARASAERERQAELTAAEAPDEPIPHTRKQTGGSPFVIESIEEAERAAAELARKGDLEGLWLLAADLLGMGEDGYEKLIEISALLKNKETVEIVRSLWHHEEMFFGRFLRTLEEHTEDVLRFRLYLESKNRKELPQLIDELMETEAESMLLGHYDGDDPELLESYVQLYRKRLPEADDRERADIARALAQIPTKAATDLLVGTLQGGSNAVQIAAVQSLAWQRASGALPALRRLAQTADDPKLAAVVGAAIHYLE